MGFGGGKITATNSLQVLPLVFCLNEDDHAEIGS